MGYEDKAKAPARPQRITMDERSRLTVTGVEEVLSFDEERISMRTVLGELTVTGSGLHVGKLSPGHRGALCGGHGQRPELFRPACGRRVLEPPVWITMELSLSAQAVQAVYSLLSGALLGFGYDLVRALRHSAARKSSRAALDALYWHRPQAFRSLCSPWAPATAA